MNDQRRLELIEARIERNRQNGCVESPSLRDEAATLRASLWSNFFADWDTEEIRSALAENDPNGDFDEWCDGSGPIDLAGLIEIASDGHSIGVEMSDWRRPHGCAWGTLPPMLSAVACRVV